MHPFGIITRIRITKHFGASAAIASLAPAIFWSMVTAGRILFAAIEKWFPEKMVCRVLPFVVAAAFVATACMPKTNSFFGILSFALAGLGCSALLPLTISFGQKELTTICFGGGRPDCALPDRLRSRLLVWPVANLGTGLDLNFIYGGTATVAFVMAALSFGVTPAQDGNKR